MDILVALLKSSERIRFQRDCWKIDWISYRFFFCIFHYSLMYPIYISYVFLLCILVCAHAYMWSLEVNVKCLPQWFPLFSLSLELDVSAILPGQPTTEVLPFLFFPAQCWDYRHIPLHLTLCVHAGHHPVLTLMQLTLHQPSHFLCLSWMFFLLTQFWMSLYEFQVL